MADIECPSQKLLGVFSINQIVYPRPLHGDIHGILLLAIMQLAINEHLGEPGYPGLVNGPVVKVPPGGTLGRVDNVHLQVSKEKLFLISLRVSFCSPKNIFASRMSPVSKFDLASFACSLVPTQLIGPSFAVCPILTWSTSVLIGSASPISFPFPFPLAFPLLFPAFADDLHAMLCLL